MSEKEVVTIGDAFSLFTAINDATVDSEGNQIKVKSGFGFMITCSQNKQILEDDMKIYQEELKKILEELGLEGGKITTQDQLSIMQKLNPIFERDGIAKIKDLKKFSKKEMEECGLNLGITFFELATRLDLIAE